jgi:hypothetical protein
MGTVESAGTFGMSFIVSLLLWLVPPATKAPRPIVGLSLILSLVGFANSAWIANGWQASAIDHRRRRMAEEEINTHEIAVLSMAAMQAIDELYLPVAVPEPVPVLDGDASTLQRIAPGQAESSQLGELREAFLAYVRGTGAKGAGKGGWFAVTKLHQNWGKNKQMPAAMFRDFLGSLTAAGLGEFDPSGQRWRLK